MAGCPSTRQGLKVRGGTVGHPGRRPGDLIRSVDAQRAATVADFADVVTRQGDALVPQPPGVLAVVRVGTIAAHVRVVFGPTPQTHRDLLVPTPIAPTQISSRVCAHRCRVGEFGAADRVPEGDARTPIAGTGWGKGARPGSCQRGGSTRGAGFHRSGSRCAGPCIQRGTAAVTRRAPVTQIAARTPGPASGAPRGGGASTRGAGSHARGPAWNLDGILAPRPHRYLVPGSAHVAFV